MQARQLIVREIWSMLLALNEGSSYSADIQVVDSHMEDYEVPDVQRDIFTVFFFLSFFMCCVVLRGVF